MNRIDIDLSAFHVPTHKRTLVFEFVDPVWAWVQAACLQPPDEMHWEPQMQFMRGFPQHKCYGGGLQYGEAFAEACKTCPPGTHPMCVSLHWDGTNAHGQASTPITIGVANTNSVSSTTQFCIGYIPIISDLGSAFASSATGIKYHIRNKAIAAILRILETNARTGVRCRLPSTSGEYQEFFLMPRLFSMNLDQPEAQLYFGMLNRT